jgi:hypothetical protein
MKKSRFTDKRIIGFVRRVDAGADIQPLATDRRINGSIAEPLPMRGQNQGLAARHPSALLVAIRF